MKMSTFQLTWRKKKPQHAALSSNGSDLYYHTKEYGAVKVAYTLRIADGRSWIYVARAERPKIELRNSCERGRLYADEATAKALCMAYVRGQLELARIIATRASAGKP